MIKAVLLLVVLFVIVFVFRTYFGKEVEIAGEHISSMEADTDCDGIVDVADKCPYDHKDEMTKENKSWMTFFVKFTEY